MIVNEVIGIEPIVLAHVDVFLVSLLIRFAVVSVDCMLFYSKVS